MDSIVDKEAASLRANQQKKWWYVYVLNTVVANNSSLPAILNIEEDADFCAHFITGTAYGPTDVNGIRQTASATDYKLAGVASGYADRGVSVQITDTGVGKKLTSGYIPVETLLTPGYGLNTHAPMPFKHWIGRNGKLQFDLRNRDTQANLYHFVSISLHGYKYASR